MSSKSGIRVFAKAVIRFSNEIREYLPNYDSKYHMFCDRFRLLVFPTEQGQIPAVKRVESPVLLRFYHGSDIVVDWYEVQVDWYPVHAD